MATMTKTEKIELLLKDLEGNKDLLKSLKFHDIANYANTKCLKWRYTDIGRSQKYDLIKALIANIDYQKQMSE